MVCDKCLINSICNTACKKFVTNIIGKKANLKYILRLQNINAAMEINFKTKIFLHVTPDRPSWTITWVYPPKLVENKSERKL